MNCAEAEEDGMSRVGLTGLPSVDCPLQSLTGKVQSVVRDLKRRRELVERKRKELDEYVRARRWRDIRGDPKDILVVNVGGEGFMVPRSTLTCVSESLLCDLFSGAFDHMLVPYQPAASTSPSSPTSPSVCSSTPPPIFLDVDPTAFRAILRVLVAYDTTTCCRSSHARARRKTHLSCSTSTSCCRGRRVTTTAALQRRRAHRACGRCSVCRRTRR
mmetsp:Transcript_29745/g.86197  ORF Transcript_29745/g.86197 Transcript_29745/m.86197 type:complete len:216 (-) Transcript_29745:1515-2162(-)